MNCFCARIRELIEASEKQLKQIGKEIGVTRQKLSHWQTGYCEPAIDDLILLAQYFDVSVDYLVGYEQDDGSLLPKKF